MITLKRKKPWVSLGTKKFFESVNFSSLDLLMGGVSFVYSIFYVVFFAQMNLNYDIAICFVTTTIFFDFIVIGHFFSPFVIDD